MNAEARKLYQERDQRYVSTVRLQKADRVPTSFALSNFPARYTGIPISTAFYDFPKWKEAFLKAADYVHPDRCSFFPNQSGLVLEIMQSRTAVWPHHGVDANRPYQFVEAEYMRAEEYDHFLEDQSDFNVRFLYPRHFGLLEPLAKLPPLTTLPNMISYPAVADEAFANMLGEAGPCFP